MNPRRYLWGAVIAVVLAIPATFIGGFMYLLLRPSPGQSVSEAVQLTIGFGLLAAIQQAPLAAVCGVFATFLVVRAAPVAAMLASGVVSAAIAEIVWWLSTKASAGIVAQVISPTMAVAWGVTAIVATGVAVRRMKQRTPVGTSP